MFQFHLEYRIHLLSGAVVATTAFLPGALIDRVTARTPLHRPNGSRSEAPPYIPATHLKGKVRHQCEALLAALDLPTCHAPRAELMCPHIPLAPDEAETGTEGSFCRTCRIFGSPWRRSAVTFSDLHIDHALSVASVEGDAYLMVQPGVGLHRDRRIAREDILHFTEKIRDGLRFRGEVRGRLEGPLIALLWVSLRDLPAIGGARSRGAGGLEVELEALDVDGVRYNATDITRFLEAHLPRLDGREGGWA